METVQEAAQGTFTSRHNVIGGHETLVLFNSATREKLEIIPALGGTVQELLLHSKTGAEPVLAPDAQSEINSSDSFRGRLLFPFCGRIPQGRYTFEGEEYRLPLNRPNEGAALHGFLYDQRMQVREIHHAPDSVEAVLHFSCAPGDFQGYPFHIDFEARYTLRHTCFDLRLTATNTGHDTAPVAFGWHPYFRAPVPSEVSCRGTHYVEVDESIFPTGRVLPTPASRFDFSVPTSVADIEQLDEALTVPDNGRTVLDTPKHRITIEQDPKVFKYVQFYLPPDKASIAIEPFTSAANSFNLPFLGLDALEPGQSLSGLIRVRTGV